MNHVSRLDIARAAGVPLALLLVLSVQCVCSGPDPVTGPPTAPVVIEQTCKLPPKPVLPTPQSVTVPAAPDGGLLICFEAAEANALRQRDAVLKQWVREVLARCGSQEVRDAGSSSDSD